MKIKLHQLAHSRAGDKGNTLIITLIPYKIEDYDLLCESATAEKVKKFLKNIIKGQVKRYELPKIATLQFVCEKALAGGVTTSLAMDSHGKTLSYALLEMEIEILSN